MELAAAVVQAMTEKSIEALGRETSYAFEFRGHFDQTKEILKVAQRFLNQKKIIDYKLNDGHVKPALIQLRKLIYEADDVVTDCLIRDEYKGDGFSGFLRRCNPFSLLQAGKQLAIINSSMKKLLEDLKAYDIVDESPSQPRTEDDSTSQDKECKMPQQDYNPNEIIGFDDNIKEIKKWIDEHHKGLQCIAIAGMGGLGKTTIAQQIYNDAKVRERFQKMIWVTVSKNFNESRISRRLLNLLGGETADSSHLIKALESARKPDEDILVVMDDMWSIDDERWNEFCKALTTENRSTCIIVTTRMENVARQAQGHVAKDFRIHKPNPLNEVNSWRLFSISTNGKCDEPGFKKTGTDILNKCGGLPLSIKTIGSLLAFKDRPLLWTEVLQSFHKSAVGEVNEDKVMASLRLSYDELKPHLKQCLLCLSVYPEDHEIRAEHVIHWWVAEDLVPRRGSNQIELGYQYLSALISRCLVQVEHKRKYDGKVYTFKIHDVVRELIMKIAESEEFCWFNDRGIHEWNKDSYWLGVVDEMITKITSFGSNSKLRSLVLVTSRPVDFGTYSWFPLSLRMLDLSGGCTNLDKKGLKNLLDWIASLKRLACLNLSGVGCLEELPSSICELCNLQLLILTKCANLKKLHSSITKMKKLIVLHVGGCPLNYLPRGLERLSNLQELTGFRVVSQQNAKACSIFELSKLINLTKLGVVLSPEDFEISKSELEKVLSGLENLKVLDIDANDCKKLNTLNILEGLKPPKALKELYFRNYRLMATLPKWVHPSSLPELQYLHVENGDITSILRRDENDRSSYAWENLEGLSLNNLENLVADWEELDAIMPIRRKYIEIGPAYGTWTNLPTQRSAARVP